MRFDGFSSSLNTGRNTQPLNLGTSTIKSASLRATHGIRL